MKKRIKIFGLCLGLGAILLFGFTAPIDKYFEIAKSIDIFATLFKEVNSSYVDEIDPKKLIDNGIHGMLGQLDPYTTYIPEESMEAFSIQTTGQYAGIGALIGIVNKKAVVTNPYYGFPAQRAGVRVGDEFLSIDGESVIGRPPTEISSRLKGNPETTLKIVIRRYGSKEPLSFSIRREKIKISNVTYQGMLDDAIGYIKLEEFTPGAGKEVSDAVYNLKKLGAKSLILDLRENPGGSLYEAVNVANIFLPKDKEVVSTRGKVKDWNKSYSTSDNPVDVTIPVAVLTNEGSASASEIVAGSLQDYDRAVLIGQKTFGKGLVQTTRQLAYNAQLKITTAKYYIPSGRCIQALDYTHRKTDGSVEKFADSLKREFKTKSGRIVYDGAGLDPDIAIQTRPVGLAIFELINAGLTFEYASKYCGENPPPALLKDFHLGENDFNNFITWIGQQHFVYNSEIDKRTDDLISAAKKEGYYNQLQSQLNELKAKASEYKNTELTRFKKELTNILEDEIGFHYQTSSGAVEVSLSRDQEIEEAKRILSNPARYQKILLPQ